MEIYAILFGYLARVEGKIQTSKVNKLAEKLGYDKVSGKDLKQYIKIINEDEDLDELFGKAVDGELTPEELHKYKTEDKPIKEVGVHEVITPYSVQHQRVLKQNREFRKIQREGAYTKILFEDLKEDMRQLLKSSPLLKSGKKATNYIAEDNTLVVMLSDFHIGATILDDFYHGGYNFDILKARMQHLVDEAIKMGELYKVEEVVVLFSGDLIEGADMRGGQKWGLEFSLSEQITKGTHLLVSILRELETIAPVTFSAIRGNHDRLTGQGNKQDTIYNDSAVFVVLDTLKLLQESGALQNTTILDNSRDMYTSRLSIYDKNFVVNHGDGLKGKVSHFHKFIEDSEIHYLITGHVHTFKMNQDSRDHVHLVTGSPMGYNDYAKENHFGATAPSQTLMVLSETGESTVKPIFMEGIV